MEDKDGQILERYLTGLNKTLKDQGEDVAALKKRIAELEAALAAAKKSTDSKDGEIAVLQKRVEDNKLTDEQIDQRVHERLDVVGRAQHYLGDQWTDAKKTLGKSAARWLPLISAISAPRSSATKPSSARF